MRRRTAHAGFVAGLLVISHATAVSAAWMTQVYGEHAEAALLDSADVQESSGLIASRTSPGIYWTHNDSGGTPRVWAVRLNAADVAGHIARNMGSAYLPSVSNVDWEDIAAGPGPCIYVFDGGDNPPCERTNKRIHRFIEPVIDPEGSPFAVTPAVESIRFEYPDSANPMLPADSNDERYDCETLIVHPVSGDLYIITKRTNANSAAARVYKLAAVSVAWDSPAVHILEFVANIGSTVASMPTGGDIDGCGLRLLVRNYGTAYEFTLPAGESFDSIFQATPRQFSLSGERQGEAICYAADGGNIVASSEVQALGPQTCPFYIVPWRLANLTVRSASESEAVIAWDTSSPADSVVEYGTTTAYGSTVSDSTAVTVHELVVPALQGNTRYYYRVSSNSWSYPAPAEAAEVYFTTPGQPGDFDLDGDVDQEDFGRLQVCLSGPGMAQNEPSCQRMHLDPDSDVDVDDIALFQQCWSGPGTPASADCLD